MEGFLFYFFFWLYWILAAFFMNHGKTREKLSVILLLCIALSLEKIRLMDMEFSLTSLLLLLCAYYLAAGMRGIGQLYLFITSVITGLAYSSFQFFALYDPVWVVFDKKVLASGIMAFLVTMLHRPFHLRITALTIGMIHGDMFYAMIIQKLASRAWAGSFEFLDTYSLATALLAMMSGLKKIMAVFEHHLQHLEKEKQKRL